MERPQGHAVSLARIDLLEKDFLAFRACKQTLSRTVSTPEAVREVDSRVSVVFVGAGHACEGWFAAPGVDKCRQAEDPRARPV